MKPQSMRAVGPRPGCCVTPTLLAIAICLARFAPACGGSKGMGAAHHIPYCATLTAKLQAEHIPVLRSHIQVIHHVNRREREINEQMHFKDNPVNRAEEKFTFLTPKSKEDLDRERISLLQLRDNRTGALERLMSVLVTGGQLPAGTSWEKLSPCLMSRLERQLIPGQPQISLALQYFKRPHLIPLYVERLRAVQAAGLRAELLVNVDNPQEHKEWADLSYSTNGSVVPVFSANVHEARAYNRLVRLARAPVVVLLQDDDLLPKDGKWAVQLLRVFEKYTHVGVVGMQSFRFCIEGFGNLYQGDHHYHEPELGVHLQYAAVVDFAPMAILKRAWESVGGLDETLSDQGVCGIFGDWELVTRMWIDGWQAMFMQLDGKEHDDKAESGTHKPETGDRCWGRQMAVASSLFHMRYSEGVRAEICRKVQHLNVEGVRPGGLQILDPNRKCPFADGVCARDQQAK
eukprot:CAMPEP_0202918748 /NCGR_PEP_ID=MMETSP1392-20130828/74185_1 /ASSEMBLY_ACC=CAM_ASM_000868 /TAXON_ID=225041 /ORGANISM="Chlamydomonas chlamydogama, Strain SAG 11-48b" /LENGTH=459 /DNA_ID=CAMNT_0049611895 /DNA_START=143 /DNA_END=1519 /DNA_ORIENTATION=-